MNLLAVPLIEIIVNKKTGVSPDDKSLIFIFVVIQRTSVIALSHN
jgi:hypothetical protein